MKKVQIGTEIVFVREQKQLAGNIMSELLPKRIKVLHLIKSLGRGGAEKLIPETAQVHDQSRFEFHCLYFYHQQNNISEELEHAGITVHHFPSGNLGLFFQVKKVREFVVDQEFDLIHAHLPWAGILSRFVGRKLSIPIVYTEHNTWERYNPVSYWGNRVTFKEQDVAIAVSNEVALSMQLNFIWAPYRRGGRLKVKVIQNGVNTEVFKRIVPSTMYQVPGSGFRVQGSMFEVQSIEGGAGKLEKDESASNLDKSDPLSQSVKPTSNFTEAEKMRKSLGIPVEAPVVGKVAVFRTQKRLWLWVELALAILRECPEAHFLLVGDGEWRERILIQIQKSGKQANFHWVGVQKQVIPYLSMMDIYLSSSEFEGLPIAMLEAMSCEVPIVATRAGGIGEVIQHGEQGFLSEIEEWEKLGGYAIQLIRDPELRQKMAVSARDRVIEKFSMKRMVGELEGIYREVLR